MQNTLKFISGGRLGDFVHVLQVVKTMCRMQGRRAEIGLIDGVWPASDGWHRGLASAYEELLPIMEAQDYIERFRINVGQDFIKKAVNLDNWRTGGHLCTCNWTLMLERTFGITLDRGPWIDFGGTENGVTLIHRSSVWQRYNLSFQWKQLIEKYDPFQLLCGTNETVFEFDDLPGTKTTQPQNLSYMFDAISSCKLFIGNQSAPFAVACALDKPRLCELSPQYGDAIMYIGEQEFSENINWYFNEENQHGYMRILQELPR